MGLQGPLSRGGEHQPCEEKEGERDGCKRKHGRRRSGPWARPDERVNLRGRTKRLWPPRITLSYNHHTPNSKTSCCNIHTHNQPAYG